MIYHAGIKKLKCENCGGTIKLSRYAFGDAKSYCTPVVSVSECCGIAYEVSSIAAFNVVPYDGDRTTDDYSCDIKKPETQVSQN